MASKINNIPTYVVYDRSYGATITSAYSASGMSQNGISQNAFDKNLSTSTTISSNTDGGATNAVAYFTIDFGNTYWNTQLGYYLEWTNTHPTRDADYYIEGGPDAGSYPVIESGLVPANSTLVMEDAKTFYRFRNVKLRIRLSGLDHNELVSIKIKEISLMGSGL
jgi:hypothetical protein